MFLKVSVEKVKYEKVKLLQKILVETRKQNPMGNSASLLLSLLQLTNTKWVPLDLTSKCAALLRESQHHHCSLPVTEIKSTNSTVAVSVA